MTGSAGSRRSRKSERSVVLPAVRPHQHLVELRAQIRVDRAPENKQRGPHVQGFLGGSGTAPLGQSEGVLFIERSLERIGRGWFLIANHFNDPVHSTQRWRALSLPASYGGQRDMQVIGELLLCHPELVPHEDQGSGDRRSLFSQRS